MRVDGNSRQAATDLVAECAKFAYGSGKLEGRSGGAGNIGVLGGRVVKFRTHIGERSGEVTKEMADSCAALRNSLLNAFRSLLSDEDGAISDQARNFIDELRQDLSISDFNAGGSKSEKAKSLLDRKVVAKAIGKFEKFSKSQVFDTVLAQGKPVSSKGVHMDFASVKVDTLGAGVAKLLTFLNDIDYKNYKPAPMARKVEICHGLLKAYNDILDVLPQDSLRDGVRRVHGDEGWSRVSNWMNARKESLKNFEAAMNLGQIRTEKELSDCRFDYFGGLNDHDEIGKLLNAMRGFASLTENKAVGEQLEKDIDAFMKGLKKALVMP